MQNDLFFIFRWVADSDTQQEAVELRLRKGKGSLQFHGILRGQHEIGAWQGHCLALNRHLAFGHCLKQSRLCARRRAVDLIDEQYLREDRPLAKDELALSLIEVADAGHI